MNGTPARYVVSARVFGWSNHVFDSEDENIIRIVLTVDVSINDELRERGWADGNWIVFIDVTDGSLQEYLRATKFGMVDAREVNFLDNDVLDQIPSCSRATVTGSSNC